MCIQIGFECGRVHVRFDWRFHHVGSLSSGHYTAYASSGEGNWVFFNDEKLVPSGQQWKENLGIDTRVYMLVYRQSILGGRYDAIDSPRISKGSSVDDAHDLRPQVVTFHVNGSMMNHVKATGKLLVLNLYFLGQFVRIKKRIYIFVLVENYSTCKQKIRQFPLASSAKIYCPHFNNHTKAPAT